MVVSTPLKNMSSSIGMMKFPIYGKIKIMFQTTTNQPLLFPANIWGKQFRGKKTRPKIMHPHLILHSHSYNVAEQVIGERNEINVMPFLPVEKIEKSQFTYLRFKLDLIQLSFFWVIKMLSESYSGLPCGSYRPLEPCKISAADLPLHRVSEHTPITNNYG